MPSPKSGDGTAASVFGDGSSGIAPRPRRELAYVEVADSLRGLIVEGTLGVGEKLPNEAELARHFGTSRATVREALSVLSSEHLIRTTRGANGGRFVAEPEHAKTSATLQVGILRLADDSQISVGELLEIRELVETPTAMLAALRRSDEDLAALEETVVRVGKRGDPAAQYEANRRFHNVLAVASRNRLAVMLGEPIFSVVRSKFARDEVDTQFWDKVVRDHASILEAVRDRDWREAGLRMSRHLNNLEATYTSIDRTGGPTSKPRRRPSAGDDEAKFSVWLALLDPDGCGGR